MFRLIFIGLLSLLISISCTDVRSEIYESNNVCVSPPADEVAVIRAEQALNSSSNDEFEIPWGFLPKTDTVYYSLEDTEGTEELLLRKLQQQTRDCREKYNNQITESIWVEVPWGDERAVYRTAYTQGIGSWSHLGTDLVHPSLKGKRNQNIGWDEAGCRVSVHEDIHGAGITHMQNRKEFEINKEEYQKVYTNCDDDCVAHNFRNYSAASFKNFPYEPFSLMHYPYKKEMNIKPNIDIPFVREPTDQDILILQSIFGSIEDRDDSDVIVVPPINKCNYRVTMLKERVIRLIDEGTDQIIRDIKKEGILK